MTDDWDVPQATEVSLIAFRTFAQDQPDDQEIPIGRLLNELAYELGLEQHTELDTDWVITAGDLRANTREALAALAHGDTP